MEQQKTDEDDKSDAGDYHSTQQETVAAFSLDNLGMRQQHYTSENESKSPLRIFFYNYKPISLLLHTLYFYNNEVTHQTY